MPDRSAAPDSPAAISALARSHGRACVDALVQALGSSDPQAAVMAATALLNLGYGQRIVLDAAHGIALEVHASEAPGGRPNGEDAEDGAAWRAWVRQRGD